MTIVRFLVIGLIVFTAVPATAQINPFKGSRTGLSQRDLDLLGSSIDRLNQSKDLRVGASDSWSDAASRSRGENVVTRIFQDKGRTCHRMRHQVTVKGRQPPRVYNLDWCLTPDGSWKIRS